MDPHRSPGAAARPGAQARALWRAAPLAAAQPGQARLGYSRLAEEDPVRIEQSQMLHFALARCGRAGRRRERRARAPEAEDTTATGTAARQWGQRPVVRHAALGLLGPRGPCPMPGPSTPGTWPSPTARGATGASGLDQPHPAPADGPAVPRWADTQAHRRRPAGRIPSLADRLEVLAGLAHGQLVQRDTGHARFQTSFRVRVLSRRGPPCPRGHARRPFPGGRASRSSPPAGWRSPRPAHRPGRRLLPCWVTTPWPAPGSGIARHPLRIRSGPYRACYRQFLPHGPAYAGAARPRLSLYVGPEWNGELVPVLQAQEVPCQLAGQPRPAAGLVQLAGRALRDSDAGDPSGGWGRAWGEGCARSPSIPTRLDHLYADVPSL